MLYSNAIQFTYSKCIQTEKKINIQHLFAPVRFFPQFGGYSLFQTLGQWGRSKKRVRDERDLVKKIGEGAGRRACKHCFKNLIPPTFKKITLQGCQMSNCRYLRCRVTRVCIITSFTACFYLLAVVLHVVFVD